MIGARQCAGSTISNGGDSSPSNWVIVRRRPLNVRIPFWPIDHATDPAGEGQGLCKDVLSVIVIILPSEKSRCSSRRCRKRLKSAALIDLGTFRSRNSAARRRQE